MFPESQFGIFLFFVQSVVDGDLCEQYSTLDHNKQQSIASDLVRTPNEVAKRLEDIRNRVW
jgi:splicing factor 3B subunit 3